MNSMDLGKRIKHLRKKMGMTQKELATVLCVSDKVISKWETGGSVPDILVLTKMAEVFNCSIDEFVGNNIYTNIENEEIVQKPNNSSKIKKPLNKKLLCILVPILVIVVALSIVLPLTIGNNDETPPVEQTELSGTQVYDIVNPSVVYIEMVLAGGRAAGSGFFINDTGRVVTNYHVIENATNGKIYTNDGKEYLITKVVGYDINLDIAIIDTDCSHSSAAKISNTGVVTGSKVYAIGYPQSFIIGSSSSTFTEGVISNSSFVFDGNNYYQTTVQITHGNSGGALINSNGEIIGITSGSLVIEGVDYMNLAIPVEKVNIVRTNVNKTVAEVSLDNKEFEVVFYLTPSTELFTERVKNNGIVVRPFVNPSRTEYTFKDWYSNSTCTDLYDFSIPVTSYTRIYAGWNKNPKITFDPNEGTCTYSTIPYNTSVEIPEDPISDGYEFVGWFTDDTLSELFDFNSLVTRDITLYAGWNKKPVVSFNTNGGSSIPNQVISFRSNAERPVNPTKEGYEFVGWYSDTDCLTVYDFNTQLIVDKVLNAKWNALTYTVFYNADGGYISNSSQSVTYNQSYVLLEPTRLGYSFNGWKINTTPIEKTGIWTYTEDKNLTASWLLINFDITYELNGGTNSSNNPLQKDVTNDIILEEPTKEYYTFVGWTSGNVFVPNKSYTIDKNDIQNLVLTANWTPKEYSITYVLNGGTNSASNPSSYTIEDDIITIQNPVKEGNIFEGWYKDESYVGESTNFIFVPQSVHTDITIEARWVEGSVGLHFSSIGNSYSVSGYSGTNSNIIIPSQYRGGIVFSIKSSAFEGNTTISSLSLPASIHEINSRAFYNCSNLSVINLSNVTVIGSYAFYGTGLIDVDFYCNSISPYAFAQCEKLVTVESHSTSLITISEYLFGGCSKLSSVAFHSNIENINARAFMSCSILSFSIPESVTFIGEYAFYDCDTINDVYISNSVLTIENYAFSGCDSLNTMYIDNAQMAQSILDNSISNYSAGTYITEIYVKTGQTLSNSFISKPPFIFFLSAVASDKRGEEL